MMTCPNCGREMVEKLYYFLAGGPVKACFKCGYELWLG